MIPRPATECTGRPPLLRFGRLCMAAPEHAVESCWNPPLGVGAAGLKSSLSMPADLFNDDLSAITNDQLYAAIEEFAKVQQTEGWRHDYTEQWDDSSVKNVAALANTFGGLLIVGVRKGKKDIAPELTGVQSEAEYKTRIASGIAANVSPVPSYSIFECVMPDTPDKRFCVIRVRESRALHLITKKGFTPVYVRNEDESRPADASQVKRLIERERASPGLAEEINDRAKSLRDAMWIG
jgi:predicted HTH transcriptional regulator